MKSTSKQNQEIDLRWNCRSSHTYSLEVVGKDEIQEQTFFTPNGHQSGAIVRTPSLIQGSSLNFLHADEGNEKIILTPLSEIPGSRVIRYLGPINLHFIKEAWAVRSEGSLPSFYHVLISEANAAARAQVAALGGNALLCYKISPQESGGRIGTQTYNLLSCSGDAVCIGM